MINTHKTNGFTLLEITIIIIIIGLMIGAITIGRDLIRNAELQSITSEVKSFEAALYNYQMKYHAKPGDHNEAFSYWGTDCKATAGECNGNNNGIISHNTNNEDILMWCHLGLAGLVQGNYCGALIGGGAIGTNMPASDFKNAGYWMNYTDAFGEHFLLATKGNFGTRPLDSALTSFEAFKIDEKIDDGHAKTGYVYGSWGNDMTPTVAGDCLETLADDATYETSDDANIECILGFHKKAN